MLARLLVALWLAQAEAAPPEAAPAPPPPAAAPLPAPEAEPAYFLGVAFGAGRRLGAAAAEVPPAYGLAVGTLIGRRYALVAERLELGAAFHFAYARFTKDVTVTIPQDGMNVTIDDVRTVSLYDFTVMQTVAVVLGPVRPFARLGVGLGMGHFLTQERDLRPGTMRATRPLARASAGLDVALGEQGFHLGAELEYARPFGVPTFAADDGRELHLFGPRLGASLWLLYDF
jgi:hypothetical protein